MLYKKTIPFLLLIIFTNSCSTNKYAAANKSYKKQVKTFAKELKAQPSNIDSTLAASS